MSKNEAKPVQEPEQAAALAELRAEAATEAPPPGSPEAIAAEEAANAPPPPDLAGEFSGLILSMSDVLKPAFPSLETIYTETKCEQVGAALAAVCNKRGWLQGGVIGGYGEEVTALFIVGPMAMATYKGMSADWKKIKGQKAPEAEATAPPAAPESEPVHMLHRG